MRKLKKVIKATILDLIVALLFMTVIIGNIYLFAGQRIGLIFGLINTVSIKDTSNTPKEEFEIELDEEKNIIKKYPAYGTRYATIKIPKIDVNLPLYYGETPDVLKKGIGQSDGSYLPGEGKSILLMGHNTKNAFRRFSELRKGNIIEIDTDYGEFKYKIYKMEIVDESEINKLPIRTDKEELMVYTCYPFINIGHASHRYVVYADKI